MVVIAKRICIAHESKYIMIVRNGCSGIKVLSESIAINK